MAGRVAALCERWDGAIPLDDLGPYQRWHAKLDAQDRETFAASLVRRVMAAPPRRDKERVMGVIYRLAGWFPE